MRKATALFLVCLLEMLANGYACQAASNSSLTPPKAPIIKLKPGQALSLRLRLAQQMAARGDVLTAVQLYQSVLDEDPKNESALMNAAGLLLDNGFAQEAYDYMVKLAQLRPQDPVVMVGLAATLNGQNKPEEALATLLRAEKAGAPPALLWSQRGISYDLLSRQSDAQVAYSRAISAAPQDISLQLKLALSLALGKDYPAALQMLQRLANDATVKTEVRKTLALVYALSGQPSSAIEIAKTTLPIEAVSALRPVYDRVGSLTHRQQAIAVHFNQLPPEEPSSAPARTDIAQAAPSSTSAQANGVPAVSGQSAKPPAQTASSATKPPAARAPSPLTAQASSAAISPMTYWVQLTSTPTITGAQSEWERLHKKFKNALDHNRPYLQSVRVEEEERFRLLVGPFKSAPEARALIVDLAAQDFAALLKSNLTDIGPLPEGAVAAAPVPPPAVSPPPIAAEPVSKPDIKAPPAGPVAKVPSQSVPPSSPAEAGPMRYWVQLISTPTREGAQTEWVRLQKKLSPALDRQKPFLQSTTAEDGPRFRLLIGPYETNQQAKSVAADLVTKGLAALPRSTVTDAEPLNP